MNLKEAFRFQNKLSALMEEAQGILSQDANVMQIRNTYLRRKVMEGAEDETTIETPPSEFAAQITKVAEFLIYLLREKEKRGAAQLRKPDSRRRHGLPLQSGGKPGDVSLRRQARGDDPLQPRDGAQPRIGDGPQG